MSFWANFKEKLKTDAEFRNRVIGVSLVALAGGTVYYYGRKHGYAKAERRLGYGEHPALEEGE